MSDKMKRVGIVGANWAAKAHTPAWRLLPNVEVAAICTAHRETAQQAAKQFNIAKPYWNYRELMADPEIDIIDIAIKPAAKFDIVTAALEAGKHVYQSLPFAPNLEQARAMRDLQRKQGLLGVVDSQFRWIPALAYMKEQIESGAFGRLHHVTITLHQSLIAHDDFFYPFVAWSRGDNKHNWLGERSSGASAWRNFGAHTLLLLTWLFGEIEEIVGSSATCVQEWKLPDGTTFKPQTDDVSAALVRLKNGGIATVSASWSTPDARGFFIEAAGSKMRYLAADGSFGDATATLYAGDTRPRDFRNLSGGLVDLPERLYEVPGTKLSKSHITPFTTPFVRMFADMLLAIEQGRESGPTFDDAYQTQRAVEAMAQSVKTRSWVRIADLV